MEDNANPNPLEAQRNNIVEANAVGGGSSSNVFFTKLQKYKGDINEDLSTWIREFDRCCVIANKTDDLVKGQYLMFCVCGRAKAVLEDFEAGRGAAQTYTNLIMKLKTTFESTSARESKMSMFEDRRQNLGETEEAFMLDLLRLYKNANPMATAEVLDVALKRKFLQGISPDLKKNLFIFCNDPYGETVTREDLLVACRKSKDLLCDRPEGNPTVCAIDVESRRNNEVLESIRQLSLQIGAHFSAASGEPSHSSHVAALSSNGGSFGGGVRSRGIHAGNTRGYNARQSTFRGPRVSNTQNRNGNNNLTGTTSNRSVICYRCGGQNHFARFCTLRTSSPGNRPLNE